MLTSFIRRKPFLAFLGLNYLISWAFLYPCYRILLAAKEGSFPWLALIGIPGAYGPTIAALLVTGVSEGKGGLKRLLKKFLIWKFPAFWYLFVLFVPILFLGGTVFITSLVGFSLGEIRVGAALRAFFPALLAALPFGPLGEELGWRVYAFPRLLRRYDRLTASILLGWIWGVWHLASFTYPGAALPKVFEVTPWTVLLYFGNLVTVTFVFSAVFLRTRGSVLAAVLLHAAFNASSHIVYTALPAVAPRVDQRETAFGLNIVVTGIVGLFLLSGSRKKGGKRKGEVAAV